MDFERFYDDYWQSKGDEQDDSKLELVASKVGAGKSVLEVGGHIGLLAKKIKDRGANVTLTDISEVALKRARERGISNTVHIDIDKKPLPFDDESFDTVVSNSAIEHVFYPIKTIKECARVLKTGGKFILLVPNIAHWRFRLWLLAGRFPYKKNTPTDELHIRFFTLSEAKRMCKKEGLETICVDGNTGLWSKDLYPWVIRLKYIRLLYRILVRRLPSIFARDIILVFRKKR
ncbi:MAG: class I SAM-dependent methyltransferase [Candidatus Altiarchaeota archaeon]